MHHGRYEEDADRRERFYYTMLGGAALPPADCDPEISRLVVSQHCNCPSVLCILPIQVRVGGGGWRGEGPAARARWRLLAGGWRPRDAAPARGCRPPPTTISNSLPSAAWARPNRGHRRAR